MAEKQNPLISNEELIYSNMLQIEAVCRILDKKEIISKDELLVEVQKIKMEMEENLRKSQQVN